MLSFVDPRQYPMAFGEAIARIRPALVDGRVHHQYPWPVPLGTHTVRMTPGVNDEDGPGLFANAKLAEALTYLRSGSHLRLPQHWRNEDKVHWPGHKEFRM